VTRRAAMLRGLQAVAGLRAVARAVAGKAPGAVRARRAVARAVQAVPGLRAVPGLGRAVPGLGRARRGGGRGARRRTSPS